MTEAASPTDKQLTLSEKLAYGAGDFGPAVNANVTTFFQMLFLTNVAGIPAGLAGSVLMIGKIWDAINDPMIGVLSDQTQSRRWGRRLPWILYGAIPFGVFFFLLWVIPPIGGAPWGLFWYYVVIGIFSQAFYTVVNLPYTALTPELTQDYNERTSLNSFRFAFSIGGSIISLLLAQRIFSLIPDRRLQYLILAAVCGLLMVVTLYWCVFGVRRRVLAFEAARQQDEQPTNLPVAQQLKIVFSNGPFLFVIGIYLCSWLALQLTASILPYFVINWMRIPEPQVPLVLLGVQGTALVMLFVWSALSQRWGKKMVYFLGMGLWLIAQVGLFALQPGQNTLMYVLAVMAGFGVSTAYLVPWSMMPDVIELDELNTGQRREGIFYGFMVLLQKLGLALGLFLVGIALETSGFKAALPGQPILPDQPESALMAIRLVVAPIPAVALVLGMVLTYFYPITRELHAEIMLKLRERRLKAEELKAEGEG